MGRKPPTGPHADVAERFGFLLDSQGLDRSGFVAAVDGAVTARSLFAILAGDRRPSRSLAVLIERTFGFRADHLLAGTGPMWASPRPDDETVESPLDLTDVERRAVEFARRSVANAQTLERELARAEAWESMWTHATTLLADLERLAQSDDPSSYPHRAAETLEECWTMAEAYARWAGADDNRRVVGLTRLFAQRFLNQVPRELADRGVLSEKEGAALRRRTDELVEHLDGEVLEYQRHVEIAARRVDRLTAARPAPAGSDLAAQLHEVIERMDRRRRH